MNEASELITDLSLETKVNGVTLIVFSHRDFVSLYLNFRGVHK